MAKVRVLPVYEKQALFRQSLKKLKGFIGGRGCIAPETLVNGVPIAEINASTPLATLFGCQVSDIPFLKGKADLYRVRTRSGLEVVVTDAHRFLTPFGWLPLLCLKESSLIAIGGASREAYQKETGRDWTDRYCVDSRLDDGLSSPSEVAFREILHRGGESQNLAECPSVSAWDEILSIKWERKGEFWDMHVPLQNHYAAHGIWHHNTGKTHIGGQDVLMSAKAGEPWVCVSPDSNVIRETTFPTVIEIAEKTGAYVRHQLSPMPRITFATQDGGMATIVFRSGEAPEKLRGGNYAGAWLDEATVMNKLVYDLIRPTLRWRGKMGPTLITATPKGTKHWTFEKFFEPVQYTEGDAAGIEFINGLPYRRRAGTCLIKASTADNPFLPPDFYESIKSDYGTMLAQQELEGDFVEIAGLMFRREWFEFVNQAPADCARVRYWDQAASPSSGCFTAGLLMAADAFGRYYVEHVVRGQWGPLERNRIIDETTAFDARKYRGEVLTFVEQEGGSGGKEIAAQMISRLSGHAVFRDIVSGKRERVSSGERLPGEAKVVRALGVAAQSEAGNIHIVRGTWNEDFISELAAFPEYKFCDQVDAFSGAFNRLSSSTIVEPSEIYRMNREPESAAKFGALATLQHVKRNRWESMAWVQSNSDD